MARTTRPVAERFWERVDKRGECWLWTAATSRGYGVFGNGEHFGTRGAHRIAYMLTQGDIPAGLSVLHHCDNPRCVNPAHLFVGTQADNVRDMIRKGRFRGATAYPGERHHQAKLSEAEVREIRALAGAGLWGLRPLGRRFGVDKATIRDIVKRKNWRHLDSGSTIASKV